MPERITLLAFLKTAEAALVLEFCLFGDMLRLAAVGEEFSALLEPSMVNFAEQLKYAAMGDKVEEVDRLLTQRGVHPDVSVGSGFDGFMTPLCSAASRGNHRTVLRLIQAGADVNWFDEMETTALEFATVRASHRSALPDLEDTADLSKTITILTEHGGRILRHAFGDY